MHGAIACYLHLICCFSFLKKKDKRYKNDEKDKTQGQRGKMKKITNQSNCENTASHVQWVKVRQDSRISIDISFGDQHQSDFNFIDFIFISLLISSLLSPI